VKAQVLHCMGLVFVKSKRKEPVSQIYLYRSKIQKRKNILTVTTVFVYLYSLPVKFTGLRCVLCALFFFSRSCYY
jgi:hypothetical protein